MDECCADSADGGLYMKTAPEGLHQENWLVLADKILICTGGMLTEPAVIRYEWWLLHLPFVCIILWVYIKLHSSNLGCSVLNDVAVRCVCLPGSVMGRKRVLGLFSCLAVGNILNLFLVHVFFSQSFLMCSWLHPQIRPCQNHLCAVEWKYDWYKCCSSV